MMLGKVKKKLKKRFGKVSAYADNLVGPVKGSVSKLVALCPKKGASGFVAKLKDFKKSLKGLSDFQKLLLLTIAVVLPAGMLISVAIIGFFNRKK